jgi:hypothetical protein
MSGNSELYRPVGVAWGAKIGVSLAIFLLLSPPGFGYELKLGLDLRYVHDSNFYRTPNNEESADSIEPGGSIMFEQQGDRLRYRASYTGFYQAYRKQSQADAPEHRLRLDGSYEIDPLTTFRLKNNFRDVRNLRFLQEDIRNGDTGLDPNDGRYQRNDLELLLQRDISRDWELEVRATQQFIDFDNNVNRSDSDSIGIGGRVLHRFSSRHRFGGGLALVRQQFDGDNYRLDADADYLISELTWIFDIGEQIQLVVNGGPAWLSTDEDSSDFVQQMQYVGGSLGGELFRANVLSCGFDDATDTGTASRCNANTPGAEPIPADNLGADQVFPLTLGPQVGDDDDEVTFFGGVSLAARFSDWTLDAELGRRQNNPSGDSIAASLTRLRGELGYAPPLARWSAYLAGSVERREALTGSTIIDYVVIPGAENAAQRSQAFTAERDSDDYRDAFTAVFGVRRQFSEHLSGDVAVSFRHSERHLSGRKVDEDDTYFFVVKLSYAFDTVRF